MPILIIIIIVLLLFYLLIRFNSIWVYRFIDNAKKNDINTLPQAYELPRYYKLKKNGEVDTTVLWPGWDGWYFFVVPDDKGLPVKMIRASLMTGLYGLEGIDNYEKLPPVLSAFDVVEYLTLIPPAEAGG